MDTTKLPPEVEGLLPADVDADTRKLLVTVIRELVHVAVLAERLACAEALRRRALTSEDAHAFLIAAMRGPADIIAHGEG